MEFLPIRLPLVKEGDDYVGIILDAMKKEGLEPKDNDILVVASKVVSSAIGLFKKLDGLKISKKTEDFVKKNNIDPSLTPRIELYLSEAEDVYGGVAYKQPSFMILWTKKNKALSINAGVDIKNSPLGYASLELRNPHKVADDLRKEIKKRTGRSIGILITDSNWYPLRNGSIGFTIGVSGFEPSKDCTTSKDGKPMVDVYGRPVPVARQCVSDCVASGALLLIGEGGERVGAVLARGVPVTFDEKADPNILYLNENEDTILNTFQPSNRVKTRERYKD
ncbi:MAG: coenzyme F420-0:L-glutamate ligase [Thaumarchaeota archaeon]|nr:coenzyme F420-0:L-glutamate ligase [Nitrososphaerota archaeon]